MLSRKSVTTGLAFIGMMLILCWPSKSYAWWSVGGGTGWGHGHRDFDHHHYSHPYFGLHVSFLPDHCYNVWYGGVRYYYCDGYYYRHDRADYIVVEPPVGTVLTSVPITYQPVAVNGTTYYTNNGVYYIYTSSGYQVVPPPVAVQAAPPAPAPQVATTETDDGTYTINIPNDKGGYTSVIIKRSGNGFVGPQGEFYANFPKVSQLKTMYGK
jgi:hypothetical protein